MKMFHRLAFGLSFLSLVACGTGAPTEPASLFGADIVEPSLVQDSYAINEGETAYIQLKLNRKTKVRTYVNWEIRGGIGRFLKPTGVIPVEAETNEIEIALESYRNESIETPTDFEVVIDSDSFSAPLTTLVNLTDLTVPANLKLSVDALLELPVVGTGVETSASLTLTNLGQVPARSLTPSSFSDPQLHFLDGVYPGTGGTCNSVLAPGSSCTVVIAATMTAPGSLQLPLTFSYNNGLSSQTKSIDVKAAADSIIAVLSGVPSTQSKVKILNITVGGVDVDSYKYKVGPGTIDCTSTADYSGSPIVVGTPITQDISAIPDGQVKICVIGYKLGDNQNYNAATFATWYKDTTPPDILGDGIAINNGATRTKVTGVSLKMTTNGSQFMYITNAAGCGSGGTWEIYTQNKSWSLSFPNNMNRIYAKFRDSLGNETSCIHASITHDSTPPDVVLNQEVAQEDPTLNLPISFLATFTEDVVPTTFTSSAIDQNGSASGVVWTVTPLSGSQYKIEAVSATSGGSVIPSIREGVIQDLAGNTSSASTSIDASVSYSLIEFYFKSVSLGSEQSCGFANDGKMYCWGSNANYQLGIGPEMSPPAGFLTPEPVDYSHLAGVQFKKVDVGTISSCALSTMGQLYCWGKGDQYTSGKFSVPTPALKVHQTVPAAPTVWDNRVGLACVGGSVNSTQIFKDVSVGKTHVCAIESQGHAVCFGMTPIRTAGTPEYSVPYCIHADYLRPGGKLAVQVSSGGFGSCVITSDNKAYCLGRNNVGQIGDASTTDRTAWTLVNTGGLPGFQGFKQISVGDEHVCAVGFDGKAYCWGLGTQGQIGDGNFNSRSTPTLVSTSGLGAIAFVEIKAGLKHSCARTSSGRVYCWGEAANGKLGNSIVTDQASPTLVLASSGNFDNVVGLEVGDNHSCALKANGQLHCWGEQSADGRLGNNAVANSARPSLVDVGAHISKRSLISVSTGSDNTCAIGSDALPYCWGAGASGKLGNGTGDRRVPAAVNISSISGTQFVQVATGVAHSCGLTAVGKIYCWGQNNEGQLGNGTNVASMVPVEVDINLIGLNDPGTIDDEFLGFKSVHVGYSHTCALYATGAAYCWGYGLFGQIGSGSTLSQSRPQLVSGFSFKQIDVGDHHSCGLTFANKAYCWGWGSLGRLGNGSTDNKLTPTLVDTTLNTTFAAYPEETFSSISLGGDHTCVATNGKNVYCWGNGQDGRLGIDDATEATKLFPATVDLSALADTSGVARIDAGKDHSCLITNFGKAACWGAGLKGRVGDGYALDRPLPVVTNFAGSVGYLGSWSISAGGSHSCALGLNGEQYCWGESLNGRLGNNSTLMNQDVPVNVLFP